MELGFEWCHAQKPWSWEFEDFGKEAVGSWLWTNVGWQFGLPASMATIMLRSWGPAMMLRNWDWTTRCTKRWGVVSIVWLRKTFQNCLSPLRSQKLINSSYLSNGVRLLSLVYLCIRVRLCFCICIRTVVIDIIMVVVCNTGYDTKQSDCEVPLMLGFVGIPSTPSLPLLPGPLWPGMAPADRALSMV